MRQIIGFQERRRKALIAGGLWLLLLISGLLVQSQEIVLPPDFGQSQVVGNISRPTTMTFAPDGRLFVAQQDGDLRVIENGVLLPTPFLSVNVNSTGERGLLGVAFDPDFVTNQYVYIYYTTKTTPIHNRVSRFTANGNVAVAGSETVILDLNNLTAAGNHNGGAIHFGADGKLYIGVGENAISSNAQTLNNLLGKILRINADGSIPTDNPFYAQASGKNRAIWALGLRNPFTFAFQPGTGRMFINDVGQSTWEEINDGIAGSNYGWPTTEGPTSNPAFREPLFAYMHSGSGTSGGCAINGGAFYNPTSVQFPADYVGDYFFGDYCGRWIRRYDPVSDAVSDFASNTVGGIVDVKVAPDGSLYYLARGSGTGEAGVYRIGYPGCSLPVPPTPGEVAPRQNYFTALPVSLTWNRVSGVESFEIQVDDTTGFSGLEHQETFPADTLSATVNDLIDCTYYWRVRAKTDGNWGAWSRTQAFTVDVP